MNLPFILPPLTADGPTPHWIGNGFRLGEEQIPVLHYSVNHLGWNDNLTFFHEETAGDQHFIDQASRRYAIQQLKKHLHHHAHPTILEIGCSSGFMLQHIHHAFPHAILMGSDIVKEPLLKLASVMPSIPLFQFDLLHCPLPDHSVDAIVLLNVLEHIENDVAALQQIHRILKPGGVAIIEVPAGPHLFDIYDKLLMHYRRYTLSGLQHIADQVGFTIKNKSHLGFFLYPGFWLVKQRNKLFSTEANAKQRVEKNIQTGQKNPLFNWLMQLELTVGRFISYPFGIRCLMSCEKEKIEKSE